MASAPERVVVLGGAAGAWGDSALALPQLLDSKRCDYILLEALAEITMGILTRAHTKDPSLGYATDVIEAVGRELYRIAEQGVRVVTNAGGVNPGGAAAALQAVADRTGVELHIASVEGDDLLGRVGELEALGLRDTSSGEPLPLAPLSLNAYLGARPIAAALDAGADIVITGRCVDSALALGPLIFEHGWGVDDLDALSHGSLAGHLLECGPQSTGGLLTDWQDVESWHDIGYPVAECHADGPFTLTKPDGTGGLVDVRSVAEQLLYEIGDPGAYLLPDVTCDWRHVQLAQSGADRVEVSGALGRPPPSTLKACAQIMDGYKVTGLVLLGGRDAAARAHRLGDAFVERAARLLTRHGFAPLRNVDVEALGAESTYGPHARTAESREVIAKISLHHDEAAALGVVVRELSSFGMVVAGLTAGGRGLPKPTPLIRLRSFLVPRELFEPVVFVNGQQLPYQEPEPEPDAPPSQDPEPPPLDSPFEVDDPVELPLIAIAHARSGDKGRDANIGVRARAPDFLQLLRAQLTDAVVARWFEHRIEGRVVRYDVPGIHALNFVLHDALGGGGISSLRFDPQGKGYAQQLLDMPVEVPAAWLDHSALAPIPEVEAIRLCMTPSDVVSSGD